MQDGTSAASAGLHPAQQEGTQGTFDRKHPYRLRDEAYVGAHDVIFVTWATAGSICLTQDPVATEVIAAMLEQAQSRSIEVIACCIMPDHVHAVVAITKESADLRQWVRYAKREASRRLGRPGMWQRSYWDRHARAAEDVGDMVEYVLNNPVRRELCEDWSEWPYSWSLWHGGSGPAA